MAPKKIFGNLEMKNNKITSLTTDAHDELSATNVNYVKQAKADLIALWNAGFKKKNKRIFHNEF